MCAVSCAQLVQSRCSTTYPAHWMHVWHGRFRFLSIKDRDTGRQPVEMSLPHPTSGKVLALFAVFNLLMVLGRICMASSDISMSLSSRPTISASVSGSVVPSRKPEQAFDRCCIPPHVRK